MEHLIKGILYAAAALAVFSFWVSHSSSSFHVYWALMAAAGVQAVKEFKQWQEWSEKRRAVDPAALKRSAITEDMQQAAVKALSDAAKGRAWITRVLVVMIAVPSVLELVVGIERAVAKAAVEPVAIRGGEWWRLMSGTYLHGSVDHVTGNMSALIWYGSILETKTSRYRLPLVYLMSCLGGSALSVLIPPDVPSIGASGGIVGLIGYLFVFARRRDEKFPAGFRAATASVFVGLITMGAIGFWYIDNPGHAGGALMGIVLAGVLVDQARTWGEEISMPVLDFLGLVALTALAFGSIATCVVLFR